MISKFIEFSIKHETGIIKLNRPDALNALNYDMASNFLDTLLEWKENKKLNVYYYMVKENHFVQEVMLKVYFYLLIKII